MTRSVVTGPVRVHRRLISGGTDRVDREDHSHLPVAGDRAPAVEVLTDDADVERGGFAGAQPAAVGAVVEHEVVDVLVIGVLQFDDEPVAGRHVDIVRGESHVLRFDLDCRGLAGRSHPRRGGARGDRGRGGGIDGHSPGHGDEHERHSSRGRRQNPAVVELGRGGSLLLRRTCLPVDVGVRFGLAGSADAADEERQEHGQPQGHEARAQDADPAGHRQQADGQAEVDDRDAEGRESVEFAVGCAHGRRSPAEDNGQQIGQCTEEDLRGESCRQRWGQPREVRGCIQPVVCGEEHPCCRQQADDQPGHRRGRRIGGVFAWRLRNAGEHEGAGDEPDSGEVSQQADARRPRLGEQGRGERDAQPDEKEGKSATGGRLGAGDDLRAQHRRPQGHERAHDGQSDPAEQIEQRVGGEQTRMPGFADVAGEDDSEGDAQRQDRGRREVIVDGSGEAGGQGVAGLAPQVGTVPDDGGGHTDRTDDDDWPQRGHHADDDGQRAGVDESEADALIASIPRRGGSVQQRLREVL